MRTIKRRLEHIEAHQGSGGKHVKVLLHLAQEELTDRELMAVILMCEPLKAERDLTDDELTAVIANR